MTSCGRMKCKVKKRGTVLQVRSPAPRELRRRVLEAAPRVVRLRCQLLHEMKERAGLANEKSVRGECGKSSHGRALRCRGSDDRTRRKTSAQERRRLRHDQISLKILSTQRRAVQVWKGRRNSSDGIHGGPGWRIAGFVAPGLEVSRSQFRRCSARFAELRRCSLFAPAWGKGWFRPARWLRNESRQC